MLIKNLREQARRVDNLQPAVAATERRAPQQLLATPAYQAVDEIEVVGLIMAKAIVARIGSPGFFNDGREIATWIGLVPRRTFIGLLARQLGISKHGDAYLRRLLMPRAKLIVGSDRWKSSSWLRESLNRRP